jgi:hypothetical protein
LHISQDALTLAGFRAWVLSDKFPEKQPVTILNEEIYLDMSKEDIFKRGPNLAKSPSLAMPWHRLPSALPLAAC